MPVFDIHAELEAIVDAFEASALPHAVCGALALAVHGRPRATKDIDVLVAGGDVPRAKQLLAALGYTLAAAPMTFGGGVRVHRVSRVEAKELMTVDLIEATGPLADALASRTRVAWGERSLTVVSRASLVAMKRLANRPQDRADLEALGEDVDD